MNKKKKIIVYLLSMGLPVLIFLLNTILNGFLPFGKEMLNSYDSFTQYSGILLEYTRLLKSGNIFYSFGAGLGFNFFSTLTYYCMSPLNLLAIFASPKNYHIFITFMTLLRFALLGGSMCFYLSKKDHKPLYIVLFSTIYALMGYTATYYYNFLWIDSVIMLPLVIHGLDKLLKGEKPTFYIVTLTITILINYYIGYMICIFSLIWFLYNIVHIEDKKSIIKTFVISSLLSGLMCAIVILPSFFALLIGKAELFSEFNYFHFSRNALTFFYSLTTGSYQMDDQTYGPALVYVGIMTITLVIMYFFNKKFTKKEKIATAIVLCFFYLSFSFNLLNYAWQFFQQPIWWQSRFSFTFSFFLITIAIKTLENIEKVEMKRKYRITVIILFIILVLIGAKFKWDTLTIVQPYTYIFLGLSILLFVEFMFLLDKKSFLIMAIVFTLVELNLNTYNSLKNNYTYNSYDKYQYIKDEVPKMIEKLDEENDDFYRMEFADDYTSDDGLYFGYNGINYFNSVRNAAPLKLLDKLGVTVYHGAHVELTSFDPVVLSLLNVKYLYGQNVNYLRKINNMLYENQHPLALGFMTKSDIKSVTLGDDQSLNKQNILSAMTGVEIELYKTIPYEKFKPQDEAYVLAYTFESDGRYLVIPEINGNIEINDTKQYFYHSIFEIHKGDKVRVQYDTSMEMKEEDIFLTLLDLDAYEKDIELLENNLMRSKTNEDGHILKATIESDGTYDYLFTSIEYEKGMKVYVDGKKIEPDVVLDALIGLPLEEGKHEIVIDYVPRGFKLGAIMSTISLVVTVFYLQTRKKEI